MREATQETLGRLPEQLGLHCIDRHDTSRQCSREQIMREMRAMQAQIDLTHPKQNEENLTDGALEEVPIKTQQPVWASALEDMGVNVENVTFAQHQLKKVLVSCKLNELN